MLAVMHREFQDNPVTGNGLSLDVPRSPGELHHKCQEVFY